MKKKLKNLIINLYYKMVINKRIKAEIKSKNNLKYLYSKINLTSKQVENIDKLWQNYFKRLA